MADKIGKYDIVERVGRGGMGVVYKAHDPVLDRFVAIKVISTSDITAELRTRFFREAQACARLSHRNVVTVYDMGEHEGQLYFVMEFLEGEELRRVIAERKPLLLDTKIAVMMQVCDGLHFAHQRGIIHRDVKPGNIMLLRNGQVKVVDFGIAQIATTDRDLTRTGLIMGTLRYIAPEQVRGRADHRADIYSVGAVMYEFLALRPPFIGDDVMQLLDQLRNDDPPRLTELDASIPPELASLVARAMRKQPGERFQDLEQMRAELEQIQRSLADEIQQVRGRVHAQRARLREIRRALAERVGSPIEDDTSPTVIDEQASATTLRAQETDLSDQIRALEGRLVQADALASALERGQAHFDAGKFGDAIVELETIIAEMPDHRLALQLVERARTQAEMHRRRQIAVQFVREAREAFDEGQYSLCLEILKQALDVSVPTDDDDDVTALRDRAEAALAAQEEQRRLREHAELARQEATRQRYLARAAGAVRYTGEAWTAAEAKLAEAQAAFDSQSFVPAAESFKAATKMYAGTEEVARDLSSPERRRAEEARERASVGQREAATAEGERLSTTLWGDAARRVEEGSGAFAARQYVKAAEAFDAAVVLYRRAENQAREVMRRERQSAEEARRRMGDRRRSAEAAQAASHNLPEWTAAKSTATSAEAAYARNECTEAARAFDEAAGLYQRAEELARAIVRAEEAARALVDQTRQAATVARRAAVERNAAKYAAGPWRLGEEAQAQAEAALKRDDHDAARRLLGEARRHYAAASEAAGIAVEAEVRRIDAMMADARRLFESSDLTRCRRRVSEVLALKPDHVPAVSLGREVDDRIRAAEAASTWEGSEALAEAAEVQETPAKREVAEELTIQIDIPRRQTVADTPSQLRRRLERAVLATAGVLVVVGLGAWLFTDPTLPGPSQERQATGPRTTPGVSVPVETPTARPVAPTESSPPPAVDTRSVANDEAKARKALAEAERAAAEKVAAERAAAEKARVAKEAAERAAGEKVVALKAAADKAAAQKAAAERAIAEAERAIAEKATAARAAAERAAAESASAEKAAADRVAAEKAAAEKAAGEKAAAERAAAERAAAERTAAERAVAAERERIAALQRQQSDAQQRQLALLKSSAEESKSRAITRRDQAVKAEAGRFAKDLFTAGEAKLAEGDALVQKQGFEGATQAYREAFERYVEANLRAAGAREAKTHADSARTRMMAEKEKSRRDSAEFAAALAEERQGDSLYERFAYREAAERFRTAEMLFTRGATSQPSVQAPAPPPAPPKRRALPPSF